MREDASFDYLLGQDDPEWRRLEDQHLIWRDTIFEALDALGMGAGARILDAGCGTGTLLADLGARVGARGQVLGLEIDERAAHHADARLSDMSWAHARSGDLATAPLDGPWDCIVSRWVFSFLANPGAVIARLASALRPGGVLLIQDYMHDGLRVFPCAPAFDRTIQGIRQAYAARGGDLWVAAKLPGLMGEAGLVDVTITPHCMAGQSGSEPWTWVGRFLEGHIDSIVASGCLSPAERAAFMDEWRELEQDPSAVLFTPMVVCVAASRPAGEG